MEVYNSRIIILDREVTDKISAGEVIDRPVSVVKELIENSIDAGATSLKIEVTDGGKSLIKVSDNGCGMNPFEAKLSIQPHATSKIKKVSDLFKIKTLGFRGEALASIVAVSRFEMLTKDNDNPELPGFFLKVEGNSLETSERPALRGTTVWVRDLFYNLPVRKKFLKKPLTELSYINELIDKFILAFPRIAFELEINGTVVLETSGRGDLKENIGCLYGQEILESLKPVNFERGKIKISGFVSDSSRSWADKSKQFFFINDRPVRNLLLSKVIEDVFKGILPKGRYPFVVVNFSMPEEEIDVNIHPKKSEVKFLNTSLVLEVFSNALEKALEIPGKIAYLNKDFSGVKVEEFQTLPEIENVVWQDLGFGIQESSEHFFAFQFSDTYLIFLQEGKIALVDQHAASERVNYERLLQTLNSEKIKAVQKLLTPQTLELSRAEAGILEENLETFQALGFEIEIFGKNNFILRGVPLFLADKNPVEILERVLKEIKEKESTKFIKNSKEALCALIACHSAIRAGDRLNQAQIQELLFSFFKTPNYLTCPHGRPAVIYLTLEELEKKFSRK